ncbi:hypothetical protein NQ317_018938 [Molorchus minor]|uniref:Fibronectin type-III domain-containing protein n=1 Tax=Molorchus minor TaxID=1323400 RepID=A0ABQ9JCV2_9CUCU|nr:hypothetical protein NQ317_018938 [Molorchus minor]
MYLLPFPRSQWNVVRNLMGEPDYRQVRLSWESDTSSVPRNGFSVRYCELQTWGAQRCRTQEVKDPADNTIDKEEQYRGYNTEVKGLRMATTYSFEVKPMKDKVEKTEREDRADGHDKSQNMIVIPTKGCENG